MTAPVSPPPAPGPNRWLLWGAAGSALLMLAGVGAFAYASQVAARRAPGATEAVTVTLEGEHCQPNALTVPAGRTSFRIVNRTERAVEWEILDGVMVVEERENIAPGLAQTLNARLKPGEYAITCGLLSNPRGRLVVTPAASGASPERPALLAFVGPLAEYQVYTAGQARDLVREAKALDETIRAGDLDGAKRLFAEARASYLHLAPVAARIGDLANAIDPLAAYLAGREDDPAFTGLHRIEYGLFAKGSTEGLAPVSAGLVANAEALRTRLRALRLEPADMGEGAARVLAASADTLAAGGADLYARTDLSDVEASLAGVARIASLLKPVAAETAPSDTAAVETGIAELRATLATLNGPEGYPPFDEVPEDRRAALVAALRELGAAMDRLNAAVGFGEGGA